MTDELRLAAPDDMHLHLRDGDMLAAVAPHTAARFARAIVMPNLVPPVTTVAAAQAYRARVRAALGPSHRAFQPLMTLYLTDDTDVATVREASTQPWLIGFKLYPAGATTNSASGVTSLDAIVGALEAMEEHAVPLLVHGEVTDAAVDIFDREAVFIDRVLRRIRDRFPRLRVVFEHITSAAAVDYVRDCADFTAATITPQHLLLNRNAIFQGGVRPHRYCLPVLKREQDREALVDAAVSGDPRFFLGTDSAPHEREAKESSCGCAGIYSAPMALELYAEVFDAVDALDRLEPFASHFGADFYGLPRNHGHVALRREEWQVPASYPVPGSSEVVVPYAAGERLAWRLVEPVSAAALSPAGS